MSPTVGVLALALVSAATWQVLPSPLLSSSAPDLALKQVRSRAELESIRNWSESAIDLVRPGANGTPRTIERVPARSIHYQHPNVETALSLVTDPYTKVTYLTSFGQAFYLSGRADLFACHVSSFFRMRQSIAKAAGPFTSEQDALTALLSSVDEKLLLERSRAGTNVDLRRDAPLQFWTHGSSGSSQYGPPTIVGLEISDQTMRLDLLSNGGRFRGTFLIDLGAGTLLKTSIEDR